MAPTKRSQKTNAISPSSSPQRRSAAAANGLGAGRKRNYPPIDPGVNNKNNNSSNNNNKSDGGGDGGDDDNNKTHRWRNFFSSSSNKGKNKLSRLKNRLFPVSRRTALAWLVVLAMSSVAIGIAAGIFVLLNPRRRSRESKERFVEIERSRYVYGTGDARSRETLGRRPPPGDEDDDEKDNQNESSSNNAKIPYDPSDLERYAIEHGRSNERMGYDKQVKPLPVPKPKRRSRSRRSRSTRSEPSPGSLEKALRPFALLSALRKPPETKPSTHVDFNDARNQKDMPSGCDLWTKPEITSPEIYEGLQSYRAELRTYEESLAEWTWTQAEPTKKKERVASFWSWGADETSNNHNNHNDNDESSEDSSDETSADGPAVKKHDLRDYMTENPADHNRPNNGGICDSLEIHPDGMTSIFESDSSLSKLPALPARRGGYIEPLLPPLRHPEFCYAHHNYHNPMVHENPGEANLFSDEHPDGHQNHVLDPGYLVHDFAAMCRNNLEKHSRTVFVDMGASLGFHSESKSPPPVLDLIRLYERFGFVFDHIYGYEVTPQKAADVYESIPDDLKAAYHWYNVGVDANPESYSNPFRLIRERFTPDDFIVVKLDIDTPDIEIPLASQLLEEQLHGDYRLQDLVDVFYFEHHVTMKEMAAPWKDSMRGSMQDSMEFFSSLREHGIATHYWI